ncbi:MAG: ATP-binding protein, partial [bacterium]
MSSNREQLQVPGHPDYLPDLREFANRVGAKHHLAKKLVNTFKLAIDEAATNIIKHAYRNYQNSITIQAVVRRKTVTFILIDQGAFFDPSWADEPDPTYAAELGQRPPLGIFMLRKLIDKIEYARTYAGNELRLTKNRKSGQGVGSRLKYPVYFAVALTAITIALLFYLRASVDEELRTAYYHSGKRLVQQVTEKIKQIKPDLVASDEGRLYVKAQLQPTYENHIWEVYSLALVDTTGRILWSTKTAQINQPFVRPESTHITGGIFAYPLDGIEVYEFEQRLSSENHDGFSGTVHVFLSQNYLAGQIAFQKLAYLKKAAVSLAISYLLIALLGYLIQNHFGKIPRFIKELFNRFTFDPIQQPVSIDNEADEDFLKVIERLNAEKVPRSLPPVDSTKAEPPQDPPKPLDASSRQVENSESLNPPLDVSSRQGHENPSGREQPTLLLSQPARNSQSLKDEKDRPENPKHGHPDTALPALNLRKFLDFMNE